MYFRLLVHHAKMIHVRDLCFRLLSPEHNNKASSHLACYLSHANALCKRHTYRLQCHLHFIFPVTEIPERDENFGQKTYINYIF